MIPFADLVPQGLSESIVRALIAALAERDAPTQAHSNRVGDLARRLGEACDLAARDRRLLALAATMHDIGKIGIPDQILLKPASFTPDEWEVMKTHAVRGERIIRGIEAEDMDVVAALVRHHHEHYDGSGYPDALSGDEIPVAARILSVVDSYDAMATVRPYHRHRTHAEVMQILDGEAGGKHDPEILAVFRRVVADDS